MREILNRTIMISLVATCVTVSGCMSTGRNFDEIIRVHIDEDLGGKFVN